MESEGFKNEETAIVWRWMGNIESTPDYIQALCEQINNTYLEWANAFKSPLPEFNEFRRNMLANELHDKWNDVCDAVFNGGPMLDLLYTALNNVDWRAVAGSFLEYIEKEEEEKRNLQEDFETRKAQWKDTIDELLGRQ